MTIDNPCRGIAAFGYRHAQCAVCYTNVTRRHNLHLATYALLRGAPPEREGGGGKQKYLHPPSAQNRDHIPNVDCFNLTLGRAGRRCRGEPFDYCWGCLRSSSTSLELATCARCLLFCSDGHLHRLERPMRDRFTSLRPDLPAAWQRTTIISTLCKPNK